MTYFLPLFQRITKNPIEKVTRNDVLNSIRIELENILSKFFLRHKEHINNLNTKKWEILIRKQLLKHESRIVKPNIQINFIDSKTNNIFLSIQGVLCFDQKPLMLNLQQKY